MKRVVAFAASIFLAASLHADEPTNKKMLKDLEGSYSPVSMTRSGEAAPPEFLKDVTFTIKDETFVVRFAKGGKNEDKAATIVLQSDAKPMSIDLTPKDGPEAGKPMLGIIKVEKDSLTLCWADRGEKVERPKDFVSTAENKHFLIVMKKAK